MVCDYRDTSTPKGKYYSRTWTEAPPEQHAVTYEGTRHGFRRRQMMIHNPSTGLFELEHAPIQSPTVSLVRCSRGTAHAITKYPSLTGTDHKQQILYTRRFLNKPTFLLKPYKLLVASATNL